MRVNQGERGKLMEYEIYVLFVIALAAGFTRYVYKLAS
jgi:hypothetical protein